MLRLSLAVGIVVFAIAHSVAAANDKQRVAEVGNIANTGRVGSVDFSENRFHLPNYNACRNLIQNPSFEDGLDYWTTSSLDGKDGAMKTDGSPLLALDSTTAFDGRCSLRQEVIESTAHPPATFAIPLDEGKEYTLSFYAKTDRQETAKLAVGGCTDQWDNFLKREQYQLGAEWKRYTYRFNSPRKVVQLYIGCSRDASPCRVWIDAVQLEPGATASDFTRLPASVAIRSNAPDNLSEPGKPAGVRILANTRVPGKGVVTYAVRNFFGVVKTSGTVPFETVQADVPAEIPVPACDSLPSGVYVVETRIELPDGFAHADWGRLTRMTFLEGAFKHRQLFTAAGMHAGSGDWEGVITLFKRMGVGSSVIFDAPPRGYQELLKKNGIPYYPTCFHHTGWPRTILGKFSLSSSVNSSRPQQSISAVKDEDIPQIVEHALKTMAENPDCRVFKTINEPFCQTEAEIARVVEILKAVRTAAKKVNPEIRIMTPDCANMDHAVSYLDAFFRHGGADACDVVGVHLYRGHPDGLDDDLRRLEALADKYKPGIEIWSTEGGYFNTCIIPDIKFPAVQSGGDHYRAGNFSYDLGLGERIALAYQVRYRIQALKHAARLKVDQDWNLICDDRFYLGLDRVPRSHVFSVNTPARLLGNADFVADLKLPKELRGYLFKDEKDRPVAAFWFTSHANLYKNLPPATLDATGLGKTIEVFDIVGAPVVAAGGKIEISGYPIFIRGEAGGTQAFQQAIERAATTFPESGPALGFTFDLKADGSFRPTFTNRFNRPLAGLLRCGNAAKTLDEQELDLKPYAAIQMPFVFPAARETLTRETFGYTWKPANGPVLSKNITLQYANIRKVRKDAFAMDGNFAKWQDIPSLVPDRVRNSDSAKAFKVETKWAWNEEFLYGAVFVTDNCFSPSKTIQFPDQGDSVTFFFDSFADAMNRDQLGYGEDDQDHQAWFTSDGHVNLIRHRSPHWQLAFAQPGAIAGVQSHFAPTADGYRFEMAIPMHEVKPIELKDGGCFSMNILVHDYDNNKQKGSAYFGSGEVPLTWRAPKEYVFMFLEPATK